MTAFCFQFQWCFSYSTIRCNWKVALVLIYAHTHTLIFRAHSRFTPCPMTLGFRLLHASSGSCLRVGPRSAWSEFTWCAALICSQRTQMAWWVCKQTNHPGFTCKYNVFYNTATSYFNCYKINKMSKEFWKEIIFYSSTLFLFSVTHTLRLRWGERQ